MAPLNTFLNVHKMLYKVFYEEKEKENRTAQLQSNTTENGKIGDGYTRFDYTRLRMADVITE